LNKKTITDQNIYFKKALLGWNKQKNNRQMPWKGEKDPYKIWLSEIILQQTRVAQGLDYYNKFVREYPTIQNLAKATDQKTFKLWEGLGYYSRCKNLIHTARYITDTYNGIFPNEFEKIIALKGIGEYTASAIASFAFNQPYAVVDGNVFRVLARFFGIQLPTDTNEGKRYFKELAKALLDEKQPGIYNQAIMDFGATVCTPQQPDCTLCPLNSKCVAFSEDAVSLYPEKVKSIKKKERWFYYLLIQQNNRVFIRQRINKDIWQDLYEFVLIEKQKKTDLTILKNVKSIIKEANIPANKYSVEKISTETSQILSHQIIRGQLIHIKCTDINFGNEYKPIAISKIKQFPFPKFITSYLKDKNVSLNLF
jgi:A/G-specific adenine glycosylase